MKKTAFDTLCKDVVEGTSRKVLDDLNHMSHINTEQKQTNRTLEKETVRLKQENKKLKYKVSCHNTSKCNQALKRKNKSIELWQKRYQALKAGKATCSVPTVGLIQTLRKQKVSINRIKKRHKQQKTDLHKQIYLQKICNKVARDQNLKLKEKNLEMVYLQDQLLQKTETFQSDSEIPTLLDGKKYSHHVREASYILQNAGISQAKTSDAIRKVTKAVTGHELVGPLPSYKLQNTFNKEMKSLSQQQVREVLRTTENATFKYDRTTKKVGQPVEVEVETQDNQTLLLGLRQQAGGTVATYAETISKACSQIESTENYRLLDDKIANTMTDRRATNAMTDGILEETRGCKKTSLKCALHALDSMAKEAEKFINEDFEKESELNADGKPSQYPFQHRNESLTQATVRTSAKLFHDTQ